MKLGAKVWRLGANRAIVVKEGATGRVSAWWPLLIPATVVSWRRGGFVAVTPESPGFGVFLYRMGVTRPI